MDLTTQKHIFGFDKGYIWLVDNSVHMKSDPILKESNARYNIWWGWYFFDEPDELPEKYQVHKLLWEEVGNDDGSIIKKVLIPENPVGEVGQRIELTVEVIAASDSENHFGRSREHTFRDDSGNIFRWTTAAKSWEVGSSHHIRGTIKAFEDGICILTRCMER